jgi:hypothetical protein
VAGLGVSALIRDSDHWLPRIADKIAKMAIAIATARQLT